MAKDVSSMPDIVEYMASFSSDTGNSSAAAQDSNGSTDTADEIKFVKELKRNLDTHQCDLCCEGNFVINKLMSFGGVLDEVKKYVCNICDKRFKSTAGRTRHIRRLHLEENFNASPFEVTLNGSEENGSEFSCDLCESHFKSKSGLKKHKKKKHCEVVTSHLCELCGSTFTDFQEFTQHCIAHTKNKKFIHCTTCKKKFLHRKDLKEHVCTLSS